MPFSDNDNQLINKMKTEAPEFYDLFMRRSYRIIRRSLTQKKRFTITLNPEL